MSLSVNPVISGLNGAFTLGNGLQLRYVDITASDVTNDYSNGYDIAGLAGTMGLGTVLMVLSATLRASGGTTKLLVPYWDAPNGKLMWLEAATADGPFTQADDAAGELVDGDIMRCVILGTGP